MSETQESMSPPADYCTRCKRSGFELFFVEYKNGYDPNVNHNIRANSVCRDCRAQLDDLIRYALKHTDTKEKNLATVLNFIVDEHVKTLTRMGALDIIVSAAGMAETQWSWWRSHKEWSDLDDKRFNDLRDSLDGLAVVEQAIEGLPSKPNDPSMVKAYSEVIQHAQRALDGFVRGALLSHNRVCAECGDIFGKHRADVFDCPKRDDRGFHHGWLDTKFRQEDISQAEKERLAVLVEYANRMNELGNGGFLPSPPISKDWPCLGLDCVEGKVYRYPGDGGRVLVEECSICKGTGKRPSQWEKS